MRTTSSAAVVTPALVISSRPMTWTGSAVSPASRLMAVPVTSTRSSFSLRCGRLQSVASAPTAASAAKAVGGAVSWA